MQVSDIPADWLANHPSASLKPDMAGFFAPNSKSKRVISEADRNTHYNGYSIPVGESLSLSTRPDIGSLIDICGFGTDPVRIGEVSSAGAISEAIVAVPFIEEEGERKFFTIADPTVDVFGFAGKSVAAQAEAMGKYVFPPSLDFLTNPSVTAVAMYIFEFEHELDKNDLSHIWQNLPPKVGTTPMEATSVVSHDLLANELMGDWKSLADGPDAEVPMAALEKIQWMVFKVKQKAKTNYYDALTGKSEEAETVETPDYTFNWPYDFCSIVELAKLDSEVQFGTEDIPLTVAQQIAIDGPGEVAATEDVSATGAPSAGSLSISNVGGGY